MSAYQVSGAQGITRALHGPRADSAASPRGLALDPLDLAWLKIRKRQQEQRHERLEVRQSIRPGPQDNDNEGQFIAAVNRAPLRAARRVPNGDAVGRSG